MNKPNIFFLSVIALVALLPFAIERGREDAPAAQIEQPVLQERVAISSQSVAPERSENANPLPLITGETTPSNAMPVAADTSPKDETQQWDVLPIAEPTDSPLAELEEAYLTESFDPAWAEPIEHTFYEVFSTADLGGSDIEQAECRATLCRFSIHHQDANAQNAFIEAFLQSQLPKQSLGSITHHSATSGDGQGIAAVYFLARNEITD